MSTNISAAEPMYYFCTLFDRNYLARGLALYQSLSRNCSRFRLWVLCLDDETYAALSELNFPEICLIQIATLEQHDPQLRTAREGKSLLEYYFTCTPTIPLFIFKMVPEVDLITYLDADTFLFSDPKEIFAELGDHPIGIVENRFCPGVRDPKEFGTFNVGWLSFRRSAVALECLSRWRSNCLEWCFHRVEDGKYADQKYLDDWTTLFPTTKIIQHKGLGLAPWNVRVDALNVRCNEVFVEDQPLILFHFSNIAQRNRCFFVLGLMGFKVKASSTLIDSVYKPYFRALVQARRTLSPNFNRELGLRIDNAIQKPRGLRKLTAILRRGQNAIRRLKNRDYVIVLRDHVL
jgi:hypothetical protein